MPYINFSEDDLYRANTANLVSYLESHGQLTNRGYQGGYRLARRPEDYTARDILRLTEGSLAPWPDWTARSTPARAARIARLSRSGRAWTV